MTTIQQSSNNNWNPYTITGGAALAAGTITGVASYHYGDDVPCWRKEELHDTFVKRLEEGLSEIKDEKTLKVIENQKNIEKEIDKLSTSAELKDYVTQNLKNLSENDKKIVLDAIKDSTNEKDLSKLKDFVKYYIKDTGEYNQHFKDIANSCWDKKSERFVNKGNNLSKEKFEIIEKAAKEIRRCDSTKLGATVAFIVAGVTALILMANKKFFNKE